MTTIKRGNTAIARKSHSKPYQYLLRNYWITTNKSILDYGCGKGYDVETLKKRGYNIEGYDKFHDKYNNIDIVANNGKCFDMVTCNYVFNVIEDIQERRDLLETLKGICDGSLIITLRADKKSVKDTWKKYNDGYITSKGTFQKFYTIYEVISFFNRDNENWNLQVLSNNSNEIMINLEKR